MLPSIAKHAAPRSDDAHQQGAKDFDTEYNNSVAQLYCLPYIVTAPKIKSMHQL
jgi:hypothetical protein